MNLVSPFSKSFYSRYFVAGIHTGAGKTLVSAILTAGLGAAYWKPVQTGAEEGLQTDTEWVGRALGTLRPKLYPEAYRLQLPQSPHWAAAAEGIWIDPDRIRIPDHPGPLIIEGAGGLMVPLNENTLLLDLIARWQIPVVLVVWPYLGSINHSLLSLEALRARNIPLAGLVFNREAEPEIENAIVSFSGARVIGRVPHLRRRDLRSMLEVFSTFDLD